MRATKNTKDELKSHISHIWQNSVEAVCCELQSLLVVCVADDRFEIDVPITKSSSVEPERRAIVVALRSYSSQVKEEKQQATEEVVCRMEIGLFR